MLETENLPATVPPTYLDCAATTPVDPRVRDAVLRYLCEEFGNAGSRTHSYGSAARRAAEQARDQVAAAVGCSRSEVIFTSGATESDNLAILGLATYGESVQRTHLVTTQIEHRAVLEPIQALCRRGMSVTAIPPEPDGRVDPGKVLAAVCPDTLLVSVMQVNNETGIHQPVSEIAEGLSGAGAYFHVDAAQGFGHYWRELHHPRIDMISLSGHKVFAPKGIGALIARRRSGVRPPLEPLHFGGGQELGLRPGTLPVHLVVGLGLAAELAVRDAVQRAAACLEYRAQLLAGLSPLNPELNGNSAHVAPAIANLSFPGIDAEEAMEAVADLIAVSNGSACTAASDACSHVLAAMGIGPDRAAAAIRFSWCHNTPEPDWREIVKRLRLLG